MRTVLNISNFFLGGFVTTFGWLVATLLSIVFIITLPLTRSCWEITKLKDDQARTARLAKEAAEKKRLADAWRTETGGHKKPDSKKD